MNWASFIIASIPSAGAVVAAVIAGLYARAARRSDVEAQRTRDLENRTADKKYDTYRPIIDQLGKMFEQQVNKQVPKDLQKRMSDFMTWVTIYGSDEVVRAFERLMQVVYHDPPAPVLMRVYADFILAVRRDMGDPTTDVTPLQVFSMRINDLYDPDNRALLDALTGTFEDVCRRQDWDPPWDSRRQRIEPSATDTNKQASLSE